MKEVDFNNLVALFLSTYSSYLLNAFMHKRVTSEAYNSYKITWDAILLGLEADVLLGLQKLLEKDDISKNFSKADLSEIMKKVESLRDTYFAHLNLQKMRNKEEFFEGNKMFGSDVIPLFERIRDRLVNYQKSYKFKIDVDALFKKTTKDTCEDLDKWLKSFKIEM